MIFEMATKCVVAFLMVLSTAPERIHSLHFVADNIHPISEEVYWHERRRFPACYPNEEEKFAEKVNVCRDVLTHDYFRVERVEILDPNVEEMYAEIEQSKFYEKFQPDNTTLFENPYVLRDIVTRVNVLKNFVVESQREQFVKELVMTCIVRYTEKPHHIQGVFLSKRYDLKRFIFVYNLQGETVLLAKVNLT